MPWGTIVNVAADNIFWTAAMADLIGAISFQSVDRVARKGEGQICLGHSPRPSLIF